MTNQYFAFLRAINVGGRYVKMSKLEKSFKKLGFENIDTYIQSGNVIFNAEEADKVKLENIIEEQLQKDLEYDIPTFLRTEMEIKSLLDKKPFQRIDENDTVYVSLLKKRPENDIIEKIENLTDEINEFNVIGNHVFWVYHRLKGKSKVTNSKLERILKAPATRRNISTIRKINKKYSS